MLNDFFTGIASYQKAFAFFFRPELFRYVIYSGIISLIIAFLMLIGVIYYGTTAILGILNLPENESNLKVIWLVFKELLPIIIYLMVAFTLYKNVILLICGPIFSLISSETEILLRGKEDANEFSWAQLMHEIWRGIRMAIWTTSRELLITLPLFLLNFIPVVGNILAFVLIFLVQSYFSGANNLDFTLERRKHNAQESIDLIQKNKYLVTGSGAIFMLLMYIPVIGFLIAPALAVISATILYVENIRKES